MGTRLDLSAGLGSTNVPLLPSQPQGSVQHGKEGMANIQTRLPPKVCEDPGDHRDS